MQCSSLESVSVEHSCLQSSAILLKGNCSAKILLPYESCQQKHPLPYRKQNRCCDFPLLGSGLCPHLVSAAVGLRRLTRGL